MDGQDRPYRSVSQINVFVKCGYRYYLERVAKVWQRPAAWTPQGTALHHAIEVWEKAYRQGSLEDMKTSFTESYTDEINRLADQTPNMDFWFASGPYKGATDVTRRHGLGLEQVERYHTYRTCPDQPGYQDPIFYDGEKYIEREFNIYLGDVPVRGFIDQVDVTMIDGKTVLRVKDVKSGKDPGDSTQLKVYQIAVRQETGRDVPVGSYWMGRTGKDVSFDLDAVSDQSVIDLFGEVDAEISAGHFIASPEKSKCMFCSVATSCEFKES